MHTPVHSWNSKRLRLLAVPPLVALVFTASPSTSRAATTTFGSSLSAPATKDTANDLGYAGSNVALPGSIFHTRTTAPIPPCGTPATRLLRRGR
jgi:hypothetical protein